MVPFCVGSIPAALYYGGNNGKKAETENRYNGLKWIIFYIGINNKDLEN